MVGSRRWKPEKGSRPGPKIANSIFDGRIFEDKLSNEKEYEHNKQHTSRHTE